MRKIFLFSFLLFFYMSLVSASDNKFKVKLDSCIDGDTAKFIINNEVKTVRFLSINSPEIAHDDVEAEPFGKEASVFTCNQLKSASTIKLQYDSKSDKEDKYGRVLAWVFVDDELLQEKLVNEGLAEVKYVYDDYKYSSHLKDVQKVAKKNEVGIWATSYVFNRIDESYYDDIVLYLIILSIGLIVFNCLKWLYGHILKK